MLRSGHIVQGALVGSAFALARPGTKWYHFVLCIVVATLCFALIENVMGITEAFSTESNDTTRLVRYGDMITLWTPSNTFLKVISSQTEAAASASATTPVTTASSTAPILGQSEVLTKPEALARGSYRQAFIIEDPDDPEGPGNTGPLQYGQTVYLRAFSGGYVSASDTNAGTLLYKRDDPHNLFVLEGDNATTAGTVTYGDSVYFRNNNADTSGLYMTPQADGTVTMGARGAMARLLMLDRFGQGLSVDFARKGAATQSSTSNDKNTTDNVMLLLNNFSVSILDAYGTLLSSKQFNVSSPVNQFSWNNVYRIGRIVKIVVLNTAAQQLSLSEVNVLGLGVNRSILLNKPLTSTLTTYEPNNTLTLDNSRNKTYEAQDVPPCRDSMTIAFWMTVASQTYTNTTAYKNVIMKGSGSAVDTSNQVCPGVWLLPSTPNLCIRVSTLQNAQDGISSSTIALPLDKPVHVAVVVSSGITVGRGWDLGTFTQAGATTTTFAIYNALQKRFYTLTSITPSNFTTYFGNVTVNTLDDLVAAGFQNQGDFDPTLRSPTLQLYIDGRLSDTQQLKDKPIFNSSAMVINNDLLLYGTVSDLVFANYCMGSQHVFALATSQVKSLCKSLVTTTVDASTPVVFGHAELPAYQDEVTLSFWAKISPQTGSTNVPLVLKGTVASPELGVILLQSGTSVTVPVMTQKYPTMEGISTSSVTVTQEWMHFCLVVSSGSAVLYVNGTQSDQATLSMSLASVFADLNVGGFVGSLNSAKFCNYAASATEIPFLMGQHPDAALNQQLTAAFQKVGCIGSPYGIDTDPGAASDLKTLLLNNQAAQVDSAFATIKTDADKYVQGDTDPSSKAASDMCYGDSAFVQAATQASMVGNQPHASCLPTAPFSCPALATIGDFDIRTHPQFYQYVNTSDINAPPTLGTDAADYIKISDLASNPQMVQDILTNNPALAQLIAADLVQNPTLAGTSEAVAAAQASAGNTATTSGTPTSAPAAALTQALLNDPTMAAQVMSDVVQNTSNTDLVKQVAQALLVNNQIALTDLVKQLPPDTLMNTVQTMLTAQNIPTSRIVGMMQSDSQVQDVVQGLVSSGKLSPANIVNNVPDSQELRDTVSQGCEPSEDFLKRYIRKDSIPCYGCLLD
ncbi:g7873 [Coccomyxa viridis]|uniref:G7873 protein n=1 Tax=Coccomyxa viridis TaxID=1274662 RepID=A0ABP1FYZ7_9CHLO